MTIVTHSYNWPADLEIINTECFRQAEADYRRERKLEAAFEDLAIDEQREIIRRAVDLIEKRRRPQ
jgi:hypothetical protein